MYQKDITIVSEKQNHCIRRIVPRSVCVLSTDEVSISKSCVNHWPLTWGFLREMNTYCNYLFNYNVSFSSVLLCLFWLVFYLNRIPQEQASISLNISRWISLYYCWKFHFCQFLWIVHSWLPVRFSLTFIYSIFPLRFLICWNPSTHTLCFTCQFVTVRTLHPH